MSFQAHSDKPSHEWLNEWKSNEISSHLLHQFTHTKSIIWRYEKEIENDIKKINLKNPIKKFSRYRNIFSFRFSIGDESYYWYIVRCFLNFFCSRFARVIRNWSKESRSKNKVWRNSKSIYKTLCDIFIVHKSIRMETRAQKSFLSRINSIWMAWGIFSVFLLSVEWNKGAFRFDCRSLWSWKVNEKAFLSLPIKGKLRRMKIKCFGSNF